MVAAWIDATRPFAARVAVASDRVVGEALARGEGIVFEGAQGVLLDEDWGFHPYTTWSRCTFENVDELLREVGGGERALRLGVARIYAHRHGPGPLPTECSAIAAALEEPHNSDGPWQGRFRFGWPDLVLARYARAVCGGVDALALTHLDALPRVAGWRVAESYDERRVLDWAATPPADLAGRARATEQLSAARPDLRGVPASEIDPRWPPPTGPPSCCAPRAPRPPTSRRSRPLRARAYAAGRESAPASRPTSGARE